MILSETKCGIKAVTMDRRWCTMEDVQADLARATGQAPADRSAFEGRLIYGDRAPPPARLAAAEQDAEVELLFGCEAATLRRASPTHQQNVAPDLAGITKMIRMVENHGRNEKASPPLTNDVIVISKLNPSAKEFIPGPVASDFVMNVHLNNNSIVSEQTKEYDEYQTEKEELAAMLKSKIRSEPQGGDSFQFRREKYAAIVNLLRLHSSPVVPSEPVALRTPDYFKSCKAKTSDDSGDRGAESTDVPTPVADPVLAGAAAADPELDGTDEADPVEVEASIVKVSNWLNGEPSVPAPAPVAAPPAAPYLGAVGYKRRQRQATTPSPSTPQSASKQGKAGAGGIVAYVPSAHARELRLQYERGARDAERVRVASGGMWETLQEELRKKDERIRAATAERIVNAHV